MKTKSPRRTKSTIFGLLFALILLSASAQTTNAQWTSGSGNTTTSDNVGIGTTPATILHVKSANPIVTVNDGTNSGFSQKGQLKFTDSANADRLNLGLIGDGSGDAQFKLSNDKKIRFYTNAIERLTIAGGNVGIGTTSPGQTLDVRSAGNTRILAMAGSANGYGLLTTTTDTSYSSYTEFGSFGSNYPATTILGQAVANWSFLYSAGASNNGLAIGTNGSKPLVLGTLNTERMRIDSTGNVGIGVTNPGSSTKLQVAGRGLFTDGGSDPGDSSPAGLAVGYNASSGYGFVQAIQTGVATKKLALNPSGGNVGIGKTDPNVALDVVGDISLTGTIHAKYQDVAEWVPSSEQLSAGTVVVLDSTKSNQVTSSSVSYDTRVAGVISAKPGIALGEKSDSNVLVATTGRVKVKVDASTAPIHIGDLLVTSDIPGVAMKSEAVNLGGVQIHRPGTLIGKALEPLEKGKGEILVLLSLQ